MRVLQQKKEVLGTDVILTLKLEDEDSGDKIFDTLWLAIFQFDQKFSRFNPESELSKFNIQAGRKVKISPEFRDFLRASVEMTRESDELFDPMVLPVLQKTGYLGSWPKVDQENELINFSHRQLGQIENLMIGADWAMMPQNFAVDSGGLGKGYLLDQLAKIVEVFEVKDYWFSLGGDLICSGDEAGQGWQIGVESVADPPIVIDSVETAGKKIAIATSGTIKRKGKGWHHIIDPRTGKPANTDVLTATITAKKGVVADVFAKCLVILGSEKVKDFVEKKKIGFAMLQLSDGKVLKFEGGKDE